MSVHEREALAVSRGNGHRHNGAKPANGNGAARLSAAGDAAILNELRLTRVRDAYAARGGRVLDHLTQVAVRAVDSPCAAVSFVERDRQLFKSVVGLAEPWATLREIPIAYSFCRHAVATGRPLIVEDARVHPLVRNNPSVRELGVIAYAGMPLVTTDGLVLGTFNVVSHEPRVWSPEELDVLRDLARAAMAEIEDRLANAAAAEHAAETELRLENALQNNEESLACTTHDLRNFLNVIAMGTALMLETEGRGNGEVRRHGERIANVADQMNRLIQNLLDTVRDGRDGPVIATERVPAAWLVECAADQCSPLARKRGLTLVTTIEPDLPDVVADAEAVGRVLSNLVGNALKFTPEGGTVTLCASRAETAASVCFSVEDTGPGIAEDQWPHIFERFWQGNRRAGGLGLGLSIVRSLVEAHGGRVRAGSAPGGGARFEFSLPVAPTVAGAPRTWTR